MHFLSSHIYIIALTFLLKFITLDYSVCSFFYILSDSFPLFTSIYICVGIYSTSLDEQDVTQGHFFSRVEQVLIQSFSPRPVVQYQC